MEFSADGWQTLMDERAISGRIIEFARCVDERDFEGYARTFAADGELVTPWGGHAGRAGLAAHVRAGLERYVATQHVSANHEITVQGDRATARSTLLATHVRDAAGTDFWTTGGHYELELVRLDEVWLFSRISLHPAWRFDTRTAAAR
ncbi:MULTISPECIES: nuclear transport factor 2 family protein [unclassified Leucobacter]|uniref:nuclear transport factor 2 family protein n=1 Tax=unclassified Leucobacter TaxID=2621730 RepID=UPI00165DC79B|nr:MULTISPECIES: nuclear transport factor 2 family protein [unclassified Leucobacter]MBC9936212.1 nuclear transport factor 2 family protein [Leucobacter sp. cx-87]